MTTFQRDKIPVLRHTTPRMKLVFAMLLSATIFLGADIKKGEFGAAAPDSATKPAKPKQNSYPYYGELESHNKQSITLKGKKKPRVILITPETRVLRNGSTARLTDAAPGERVSGSVRKNAEGKEEAATINLKGQP